MGPRTTHSTPGDISEFTETYEDRKILPLFGIRVRGHNMFKCSLRSFQLYMSWKPPEKGVHDLCLDREYTVITLKKDELSRMCFKP